MAFDAGLAERVRALLAARDDVRERKMFGGLGFILAGNMCCGVSGDELLARVDPDATDALLAQPGAHRMQMKGRAQMRGWLKIAPDVLADDAGLERWVRLCESYAASLPPK